VPVAVTLRVTLAPTRAVCEVGAVVMAGVVTPALLVTDSVAAVLVTLPAELLTTTS